MKERPIPFSSEMVLAILQGRKLQTRRPIKRLVGGGPASGLISDFHPSTTPGFDWAFRNKRMRWNELTHDELLARCPYGKPGDQLWVRETWCHTGSGVWTIRDAYNALDGALVYKANEKEWAFGWWSSAQMPRWASRILLEITNIRLEPVQNINRADAVAEGLIRLPASGRYVIKSGEQYAGLASFDPIEVFERLWDSLYASTDFSWGYNPWVWVIEFKVVEIKANPRLVNPRAMAG